MKKVMAAVLALLTACSMSLWAQNVEDISAPPIEPDSGYSVPGNGPVTGQIHGFIPMNWAASMITLVDLQTEDGQNWFNGLFTARLIHDQTQFVCQNPGPATTSTDAGDFYFYDLPSGSYVVAACMQAPDGNWRSGAQVIQLNPGQDATLALGPAGGPVMRGGVAFAPDFYVGLWSPISFGANWVWGWPVASWHATVFYRTPVSRIAPIWVRPAPIVVGARIFVPPYSAVIRGNYSYLAYRNGGFVQTSPRPGVVLPPAHEFHPVAPEVEARMHASASVRTAQPNREPAPIFGNEARDRESDSRPAATSRDAARPAPESRNASLSQPRNDSRFAGSPAPPEEARPAVPPQPRAEARPAPAPAPQPRPEARSTPPPQPQPRQETRSAPQPRQESRPAPAPREESRPVQRNESQSTPQPARTWAARRTT